MKFNLWTLVVVSLAAQAASAANLWNDARFSGAQWASWGMSGMYGQMGGNFSGGCCDRQPSCCDGLWNNYCQEKTCGPKRHCRHWNLLSHCCPPAPKCCPQPCEKSCCGRSLLGGLGRHHGCGCETCNNECGCAVRPKLFSWLHGRCCDLCNTGCGCDDGDMNLEALPDEAPATELPPAPQDEVPAPPKAKSALNWLVPPSLPLLPTGLML